MENTGYKTIPHTNNLDLAQDSITEKDNVSVVDYKMVTFSLAGKDYAIDIMQVKEIAKTGRFTYVPNTLPFVLGVYNLRGEIIPIIDLRLFFNIDVPEREDNSVENMLIVNVGDQLFGVVVDAIDKVVGIQKSTIQPPHPLFGDINIKYIYGVVECQNHLYILLDIERIFTSKSSSKDSEKRIENVYVEENAPVAQVEQNVNVVQNQVAPQVQQMIQSTQSVASAPIQVQPQVVQSPVQVQPPVTQVPVQAQVVAQPISVSQVAASQAIEEPKTVSAFQNSQAQVQAFESSASSINVQPTETQAENINDRLASILQQNICSDLKDQAAADAEAAFASAEAEQFVIEDESLNQNAVSDNPLEQDYKFVVEELANLKKFYVSPVNEDFISPRFNQWVEIKGESQVQLQSEKDAAEFLAPFWSPCNGTWWTKEYADEIFNLLPDNSAKQIVVWNPGCGKGAESYSLACVLKKRYPESKIRIYAQDIDLLDVSNAPLLTIPETNANDWYAPYVTKKVNGEYTFTQEIKDIIMFEYHDCTNSNSLPMVDIVFARDVLSILPIEAQESVITDFDEKLKGNGIIILGCGESLGKASNWGEKTVGSLTYFNKQ